MGLEKYTTAFEFTCCTNRMLELIGACIFYLKLWQLQDFSHCHSVYADRLLKQWVHLDRIMNTYFSWMSVCINLVCSIPTFYTWRCRSVEFCQESVPAKPLETTYFLVIRQTSTFKNKWDRWKTKRIENIRGRGIRWLQTKERENKETPSWSWGWKP